MLTGIKLRANPTSHQKLILSQWMGCARSIWNAKVEEERYYRTYARKYCTIGTYAPIDQTTSQFKSKELSPWLSECPSQILRNRGRLRERAKSYAKALANDILR